MSVLRNLEELCPRDGIEIGEHTVREWDQCTSSMHVDLPYEDVPGGPMLTASYGDNDSAILVADTVTARALLGAADTGRIAARVPILLLDFQVGWVGHAPVPVVQVAFMAPPDVMRKAGKLLRDTADGAANAFEKAGL